MAFRPGDAVVQQLLLQKEHRVAVLGVDQGQGAEIPTTGEAFEQNLVVDHDGALVRHEVLEAVDAAVCHGGHLLRDAVRPPGDRDVEGVVGDCLLRPLRPLLVGVEQALLRARNAEIDDHRGAAGKPGSGAGIKILGRDLAHERQLHVGVRIDPARHDVGAAGIDLFRAGGGVEVLADGLDDAVLAEDVGAVGAIGGHDRTAADQHGHLSLPLPCCRGQLRSTVARVQAPV